MDFSSLLSSLTGAAGPSGGLPPMGPGLPDMSVVPPVAAPAPAAPSLGVSGGLPMPRQPMPQPQRRQPGVRDSLLEIAPMIMSMFVARKNPQHAAALIQGVLRGQEVARAQQVQGQAKEQERREAIAKYMQNVAADAQQFDDPEEHTKFLQFAKEIGTRAFGETGDWTGSIAFPASKIAKQKKAEAAKKLADLEGEPTLKGYIGTPEFESFTVTMGDGSKKKVSELRALAGLALSDASGQPVAPKGAIVKPENLSEFEGYLKTVLDEFKEKNGREANVSERRSIYLTARKEYQQIDDRPVDPTLQAVRELALLNARDKRNQPKTYTPAQDRAVNQLADDFARDSKDFITRSESYDTVKAAAKEPTAAGDLSLIFAYMKMLDPGSVVREGEFATAQNSTGVPDRIRNMYNQIVSGNRLNPAQRADFVKQAANIYATSRTRHERIRQSYATRAVRRGLDPNDVIMEYGSSDEPPAGAAPPAAGPKAGTTKIGRFEVTVSK